MKVYIAGPMSGLPGNNYPAFNRAARDLAEIGFEPLNPVDVGGRIRGRSVRSPIDFLLYTDEVTP